MSLSEIISIGETVFKKTIAIIGLAYAASCSAQQAPAATQPAPASSAPASSAPAAPYIQTQYPAVPNAGLIVPSCNTDPSTHPIITLSPYMIPFINNGQPLQVQICIPRRQ